MIDVENDVYSAVCAALTDEYPSLLVAGEPVTVPSAFPCVSVVETENAALAATQDSGCLENHAAVSYEITVFSNETADKKAECRSIMHIADAAMTVLGFTRTALNPVPNNEDATVYRLLGRFTAVISKNKTSYRR